MVTTILLVATIGLMPATAGPQAGKYAGRPVADVLRELQTAELRIIFSAIWCRRRCASRPNQSAEVAKSRSRFWRRMAWRFRKGRAGRWSSSCGQESPPNHDAPHARPSGGGRPDIEAPTDASVPVRIEERVEVTTACAEPAARRALYTIEPAGVHEMAGSFENVFQRCRCFPARPASTTRMASWRFAAPARNTT